MRLFPTAIQFIQVSFVCTDFAWPHAICIKNLTSTRAKASQWTLALKRGMLLFRHEAIETCVVVKREFKGFDLSVRRWNAKLSSRKMQERGRLQLTQFVKYKRPLWSRQLAQIKLWKFDYTRGVLKALFLSAVLNVIGRAFAECVWSLSLKTNLAGTNVFLFCAVFFFFVERNKF